ncbi:MAG: thioredoxin family protein [Rhodocyclaceae bacterium]|nr:thioredoxin family protein [Rhodocyclaceae bacterium]
MLRLTMLLGCLLLATAAFAQTAWVESGSDGEPRVHLWFFWSETCPHCREAHPFIEAIPRERPWVVLHSLGVSRSRDNAQRFVDMAKELGQQAAAVPTLMFCGRMEVGWQDAATSGARLLQALDACRTGGTTTTAPAAAPVQIPFLGAVDPAALPLPLFTVIIAGLDAFNPCAFFVLLFLLSLLAHQKDRRRMLTVGGIFIAASGLMYFAFMAAWLNVFQWLGALTWITLAAGILAIVVGAINVKDFFAFERGITLSIPESAKPDIYRKARAIIQSGNTTAMLTATVFLAIAANFYELLCTAGFPMVYTRILTLAELSPAGRYAYLAFYNAIYVVPLALIVLAFVGTLSAHKLTEREGRLLKLMSGAMMLELGLVLAFRPEWLNSLAVTAALVAVALGITLAAARLTRAGPVA